MRHIRSVQAFESSHKEPALPRTSRSSQSAPRQALFSSQPRRTAAQAETDAAWHALQTWLPSHWQAHLQSDGLIQRKRKVCTLSQWLRWVLLYVSSGLSLRSTAFVAHLQGLASMTDQAVRTWLLKSATPLQRLIALVLHSHLPTARVPALRIHDGSVLCGHGADRPQWRVHLTYDLRAQRTVDVQWTTETVGETLGFAQVRAGDVVLGDRNYARARGLHSGMARGAHPLVRVYLPSIRRQCNRSLHAPSLLRRARRGDYETKVLVPYEGRSMEMRLVMVPLPSAQAAQARRKLYAKARKKGKRLDPKAVLWAGSLCILTTVPESVADAHTVASWYRWRWQVELAFKRCKS